MKRLIILSFFMLPMLSFAQEGFLNDITIPKPGESLSTNEIAPTTIKPVKENYITLSPAAFQPLYMPGTDFANSVTKINRNFSYMLYNSSNLIDGIGGSYEAGGMLIYRPTDKLVFSFGGSAMQYSMNGNNYKDFLLNASMTYTFTDWLKLHLYGQYAFNAIQNSSAGGYGLSPQSCYGAMFMIKVMDKKNYSVDMNIGAERMFNPHNKRWELNYRLGPEIRLK